MVSELKRSGGIDSRRISPSVTGSILRVWSFSVGRFITGLLLGAVVFLFTLGA